MHTYIQQTKGNNSALQTRDTTSKLRHAELLTHKKNTSSTSVSFQSLYKHIHQITANVAQYTHTGGTKILWKGSEEEIGLLLELKDDKDERRRIFSCSEFRTSGA